MKKFQSSLDQFSTIVTYSLIALCVVMLVRGVNSFRSSEGSFISGLISFWPVLLALLVIAMYCLKPTSVNVDNSGITIDRQVNPVVIGFREINSIRLLQKAEMSAVIRTFGNGGVYGYTGKYYNKALGSMTWYCTQRKNYMLIETTANKKIIITPDDPGGLLLAVRAIDPSIVTAPSTTTK